MRLAAIAIVLAIGTVASASPTSEHPLDDQARVIDAADEAVIEDDLRQLKTAGVEMAVIVVQRTGMAIESYARDAAESWSTGRGAAAVLVIAIGDRKSRIEVSDTLRTRFTDQRAQSILDNARGYLRSSDYDGAVRAIVAEVSAAHRGIAPDFESPHPESGLPPTVPAGSTEPPPSRGYDSYQRRQRTDYTWLAVPMGIVVLLGFGALWAASARKANFTLSHDGSVNTLQRSFVVDWLWHTAKIVGYVGFILFIIAAASGKGSSSTSSSSWGSSSGGGFSGGSSGGSSGGGWSGGGASSGW